MKPACNDKVTIQKSLHLTYPAITKTIWHMINRIHASSSQAYTVKLIKLCIHPQMSLSLTDFKNVDKLSTYSYMLNSNCMLII